MPSYVLGISGFFHDSAAALIRDGMPVAAAQEERFSRIRHDPGFPAAAVSYCLQAEKIRLDDLAAVVYYEDSKLKFRRVLSSFASAGPGGARAFVAILPEWLRWKRKAVDRVDAELRSLGLGRPPRITASQHHRSHAASAFFPSPFERAAVLCLDGVGEWHTTSIWQGRGNSLTLINSISYPHSLGLLYSAFTHYCGFKVDSGEYKLMGLAPYGRPIYAERIRERLLNLRPDASFTLDLRYFEYLRGETMVGTRFERLFDGPIRRPEAPLTQRECDLASSVQKVTEEVVLALAAEAARATGESNLCLAGGVALNCVANGVLGRAGQFDSLWIQPAAGDAGCALGAALDHAVTVSGRPHLGTGRDAMSGALLGPSYSDADVNDFLTSNGYSAERFSDQELSDLVARRLAEGAVVGWFQGRMEYGPRALGARSILGDPRNPQMQKTMNLKIKFRESFRPFAPAVLDEDAGKYFDLTQESPYMLLVGSVADSIRSERHASGGGGLGSIKDVRSDLPAVTHVDLSARVQTVDEFRNPTFHRLLRSFRAATGCSVLINTSFNVRGEPIVRSPAEAYACFMRTGIDVLVLGNHVLEKTAQPHFVDAVDWRAEIPLD